MEILTAYITVLERPAELFQVCAAVSGDITEVRSAVIEAFDVSEVAADAILSMQVKRFTPTSIERIRGELADLVHLIADAGKP